jgi:hypothetical protein
MTSDRPFAIGVDQRDLSPTPSGKGGTTADAKVREASDAVARLVRS